MVRHRTASKQLSQSRYRWTVSDAVLVIDMNKPQGAAGNAKGPALFIIDVGGAVVTDGLHPVDQLALVVARDEIFIAGVLDQAGNPLQGPVPVLLFPFVALGRPVEDLPQTVFILRPPLY